MTAILANFFMFGSVMCLYWSYTHRRNSADMDHIL